MYSHLIAHLALAEALLLFEQASTDGCDTVGSGSDPCNIDQNTLREAVEKATQYTIDAQGPYVDDSSAISKGGWRYTYQTQYHRYPDVSHTIWAIAALTTAEKSGISVPPEAYQRATKMFDWLGWYPMTDQGATINSLFSYSTHHKTVTPDPNNDPFDMVNRMTATSMLAHMYMGVSPQHSAIQQ